MAAGAVVPVDVAGEPLPYGAYVRLAGAPRYPIERAYGHVGAPRDGALPVLHESGYGITPAPIVDGACPDLTRISRSRESYGRDVEAAAHFTSEGAIAAMAPPGSSQDRIDEWKFMDMRYGAGKVSR